jgi:hypothetical protein
VNADGGAVGALEVGDGVVDVVVVDGPDPPEPSCPAVRQETVAAESATAAPRLSRLRRAIGMERP